MSKITFAEDAWDEYLYWQSQDKKTLKKINSLLKKLSSVNHFLEKENLNH